MTQTVPIHTASADYAALAGTGLLANLARHLRESIPTAQAVALVTDANLPASTKQTARDALTGYRITETELTPSEPDKSIATWQRILADLAAHRLERTDAVIALGGGIVGDTAAFAAAAYRRGVSVIQCPTTLLSMTDASIGGKTGVNLSTPAGLLKNFVGAFHQPARVLADVSTLHSLHPRDFASGLAECIKHAMISAPFGQPDLGTWLDANLDAINTRDETTLTELVARNIRLKAAVVATDERETASGPAGRALLNLGHTFAHAIETLPNISTDKGQGLLHGEAVALGLVAAATYAVRTASLDQTSLESLLTRLQRADIPSAAHGLPDAPTIAARMHDDKKSARGRLRLVIPTGPASATVTDDINQPALSDAIAAITA